MPDTKPLLLIVDDDPLILDGLGFALSRTFEVVTAQTRPQAITLLRQLRTPPDLALIDLGLPPLPHRPDEGFALITDLQASTPELKVFVLSGQNEEDNARHARTLGAVEFVDKPCDPAALTKLLLESLKFSAAPEAKPDDLIGDSLPMQRLRLQLAQYANLSYPVLIEGESGCGKDIVAQTYLHRMTSRQGKPFLAVNCAAISPTLLEPTLFGYAKGAFTGASIGKSGYFEDADGGTLFLDEIGELPLELQPKLLRVLENGEYQRVGETQTRISTARIIAATNRDLRHETRTGRFRTDLFHRLTVFTVTVPPLRDRGGDRELLLQHFRQQYARQANLPPFTLANDAAEIWRGYAFPGNVRELRNIVIRLTARYAGQPVSAVQLQAELDSAELPSSEPPSEVLGNNQELVRHAARRHLGSVSNINLDATLETWEQAYIDAAIELSAGNMTQAARRLGINRTTLYHRMESRNRR